LAFDAVIVGAGHNGLAAGVILARAGWKVLILEAQPEPGGAVRTAEVTLPGFRHDLYATTLNAFAGSAFMGEFGSDLARHGLALVRAAKAFCSVFPDGDVVGVTTSLDETLADLRRLSAHDAEAWRALVEGFKHVGPRLIALLREPMPSWAHLRAPFHVLRLVTQSSGTFVRSHFESPKVQALMAVWGMHLDYPPHVRGGALYPFLSCMLAQANGLAFGKGGARNIIDAMAGVLREKGGELRCSSPVNEVVVEDGAATAVVVNGERVTARRAVIANLTPTVLFRLTKEHRLLKKAPRYRYGPGTMMLHLALSDFPDWRNPRTREFAYVHIAPSLEAMSKTYRQAMSGVLPDEPVLVVAQQTVADPSRAPQGKHVVSIQVRDVPAAMDKEAYADRIIALLERYAPGVRQKILGRHVISPADLERANPNLVGGDNIAGSHHLDQQFIFRPFFGWWRYRTPVRQLYMCGASTWPGAGTGAGSGYLLGQLLSGALR
jgi:phytoene dehydrogenase-like protein